MAVAKSRAACKRHHLGFQGWSNRRVPDGTGHGDSWDLRQLPKPICDAPRSISTLPQKMGRQRSIPIKGLGSGSHCLDSMTTEPCIASLQSKVQCLQYSYRSRYWGRGHRTHLGPDSPIASSSQPSTITTPSALPGDSTTTKGPPSCA